MLAKTAHSLVPDLSRISAGLNIAMGDGSLSSAAIQTSLVEGVNRLIADLESALADARKDTDVRVVVDASGAWIDQNIDGNIDSQDQVNGALVTADFGTGKNADPATHHLDIAFRWLPSTTQSTALTKFGTDDHATFKFDTSGSSTPLDLKWSAADANAALSKQNITLTARGAGSSASLSIGKLPSISSTQGITANFGALVLVAAGDADKFVFSQAKMLIGLGGTTSSGAAQAGNISGPIHVQAAGQFADANLTAISNAGLLASDITTVATGSQAKASATLRASGSGVLSANHLTATSYGERGVADVKFVSVNGNVQIGSQISALSAGDGANSAISINTGSGSILLESLSGNTASYGPISAIAAGSTLATNSTDLRTIASVALLSAAGNIRTGEIQLSASGANSSATINIDAPQGVVCLSGPVSLSIEGVGSTAKLKVTAQAPMSTEVGLTLGSTLTLSSLAQASNSAVEISLSVTRGGFSQLGGVDQSSLGSGSSTRSVISAVGSVNVGNQLSISSEGARSSAVSSLTSGQQISIGGTSGMASPYGVLIKSSGYGSTAALDLSGDTAIAGGVQIYRSGAASAENRLTQLSVTNLDNSARILGDVSISTVQSATGGSSSLIFGIGKNGAYAVDIQGTLDQNSQAYGSRVSVEMLAGAGLGHLNIGGSWWLQSRAQGDLVALNFGSSASIALAGGLHQGSDIVDPPAGRSRLRDVDESGCGHRYRANRCGPA